MLCILFSKQQFLVIFSSHPFESIGNHNLQTIFEELIKFPFVLQSLMQWSLSFALYVQHGFLWYTRKYSFICHVNSVILQKPIHLPIALTAVESSLYAPITKVPAVVSPPKPSPLPRLQLLFTEHSNEASLSSHQELDSLR